MVDTREQVILIYCHKNLIWSSLKLYSLIHLKYILKLNIFPTAAVKSYDWLSSKQREFCASEDPPTDVNTAIEATRQITPTKTEEEGAKIVEAREIEYHDELQPCDIPIEQCMKGNYIVN